MSTHEDIKKILQDAWNNTPEGECITEHQTQSLLLLLKKDRRERIATAYGPVACKIISEYGDISALEGDKEFQQSAAQFAVGLADALIAELDKVTP